MSVDTTTGNINNIGRYATTLLLLSICFISVVGAEFAADWHNNILLLLLILLIAIIVVCSCLNQLVPSLMYPFLIVAIAFSLILHVSLISPYLIGYDVHGEYHFASLTALNSRWDRTLQDPLGYNGMLSITILPVMCSIVLGIDLNEIFKSMYPLLYSLVPLVLYLAYRKLTSPRIAFLSAFWLMSSDMFYGVDILGLAREMIAGLFLALLIFLILDWKIPGRKRSLLFLVFGVGLIVSHYAVSYIFMFCILFVLCFAQLFQGSQVARRGVISIETVLFYVAATFAWYIFVSPVQTENVASAGMFILRQILSLASPPGVVGLVPPYVSPIHQVAKYLFLGLQLFVVLGLLLSILTRRREMFSGEYLALSAGSMLILAGCIGLPAFASITSASRFYAITMFFLSLFGVLGIIVTVYWIGRGIASLHGRKLPAARLSAGTAVVAVLLVLLLLFQTGFVYEVTGDEPSSISLGIARREAWTTSMDASYTSVEDVVSAQWLSWNVPKTFTVYSDRGNWYCVLTSYGSVPAGERIAILNSMPTLSEGEYLYLGSANVLYGRLANPYGFSTTSQLVPLLDRMNPVYSNGQGQIYWSF
jgi:uncharacterized membrane protein